MKKQINSYYVIEYRDSGFKWKECYNFSRISDEISYREVYRIYKETVMEQISRYPKRKFRMVKYEKITRISKIVLTKQ